MAGLRIAGNTSGNVAEVTAANEIRVALPLEDASAGKVRFMSENDPGDVTGTPYLYSPETDEDFRLRVAQEVVLDSETFNYAAQNTGKFYFQNTTMAASYGAAGFTTNSANIITTTTGLGLSSYATFPLIGTTEAYCEVELAFTVTKTSCGWSLRDPRGDSAGDRATWKAGTPIAGRKDWKGKSLTPTGFISEVERLIGTDRAHALLVEATFGVKPAE